MSIWTVLCACAVHGPLLSSSQEARYSFAACLLAHIYFLHAAKSSSCASRHSSGALVDDNLMKPHCLSDVRAVSCLFSMPIFSLEFQMFVPLANLALLKHVECAHFGSWDGGRLPAAAEASQESTDVRVCTEHSHLVQQASIC